MNRKCGCCFSHPLQFPRENCTFCGGSGFREVIEVDSTYSLKHNFVWNPETKRSKSKTQTASKERNRKKIEEEKLKKAAIEKKKIEAKRKKAQAYKLKKKATQYQNDKKYFEPSPRVGSEEYEIVKRLYAGRLFKCLNCKYEANLYKDLSCGNCGLKSGYEGLN